MAGHVAKLILSVDLGRDWRRRGVGEGEVVVVELISLPYRHPGPCCTKRALRPMRRVWRQSCGTTDRRGKNKVVQVHGVVRLRRRWLLLVLVLVHLRLHLLVRGGAQLLGDSAGSSAQQRPCVATGGRRGRLLVALGHGARPVHARVRFSQLLGKGAQWQRWKRLNGWRLSYPLLRCSSARRILRAIMRQVRLDMRSALGSCVLARE